MVANNARHTALMTLRGSLPNNLATRIVKKSSVNHRYNEKLKNTRRRSHVGHLPNNLTRHINRLATRLAGGGGLTSQLNLARVYRSVKGYKLAQAARNNQERKAANVRRRDVRNGRLTPKQSHALLMQNIQRRPVYVPFF